MHCGWFSLNNSYSTFMTWLHWSLKRIFLVVSNVTYNNTYKYSPDNLRSQCTFSNKFVGTQLKMTLILWDSFGSCRIINIFPITELGQFQIIKTMSMVSDLPPVGPHNTLPHSEKYSFASFTCCFRTVKKSTIQLTTNWQKMELKAGRFCLPILCDQWSQRPCGNRIEKNVLSFQSHRLPWSSCVTY